MVSRHVLIGLLAGLAAAFIGGSWQVVTRHGTTSTMAPSDLAILRYLIPTLILMPLVWRTGLLPRAVPRHLLALMVAGAGLPFGLIAMSGTQYAPPAHMGVLMAGASPLFATAFAWLLWRDKPSAWRSVGLLCMVLGIVVLGSKSLSNPQAGAWRGDLLFLLAAALWAGFTLSFRRTGLTAWQGAALVNTWSALFLLPWLWWRGGTGLLTVPLHDLLFQALWQGVFAGILGLAFFAVAIARLGAAPAAAFGALAPVVSALVGRWWLGEALSAADMIAVVFATLGVALASDFWRSGKRVN